MSFKVKDHFFKKAKSENYLARSVYKLEELNKKFKFLNKGICILDLGYFPGSWTQYCSEQVGPNGKVIGVDIQGVNSKLANLKNVQLYENDVFAIESPEEFGLQEKFDCVISDMAPKTTGIKGVDQDRSFELVSRIFDLCPALLKENGYLVAKIFESGDTAGLVKKWRKNFNSLEYFRPKSIRKNSKEVYIVGSMFKDKV